jgi:5-formyltetrahydrofolate cyclo-ligase
VWAIVTARPVNDAKKALRAEMRARRAAADGIGAGARLRDLFLAAFPSGLPPGAPRRAVVSGYCAMTGELDVRALLLALMARGHVACLPVVIGRGLPLEFRRWRDGDPLIKGALDIDCPTNAAPLTEPDVLLVPLLAFDAEGYRLGQGGGYYDRTIARLRAARPIVAVGVAHAFQELDEVSHDPLDQRLDWIVTERDVRRVAD